MKTNFQKKKILCKECREMAEYTIEYLLLEDAIIDKDCSKSYLFNKEYCLRKSYDICIIKKNKCIEECIEKSSAIDFEWRYSEAFRIFDIIVKGEVTPLCLEDVIQELI